MSPRVPPGTWTPDAVTLDVLRALSTGLSVPAAAAASHVSERTLRRRVREAQRRWGTATVVETVVHAVRRELI